MLDLIDSYFLWSQAFETFFDVHRKIRHLTHDPPDVKDATYEDWFANDCVVISWLVNSIEESISRGIMMLKLAKKIWDTLKSTYSHDKNIAKIYEQIFTIRRQPINIGLLHLS